MITLKRKLKSKKADAIEQYMREMSLAYKKIIDTAVEVEIHEDGKVYNTTASMYTFLEELQHYKSEWEKFQTDSCYLENDGSIC